MVRYRNGCAVHSFALREIKSLVEDISLYQACVAFATGSSGLDRFYRN